MNTTDWQHYYSVDNQGTPWPTGALYEPLVNPDGNILCMRFDPNNSFRNEPVSIELAEDCFRREVKYLKKFSQYNWCAKLIDVDTSTKEVYIEWNKDCCEKIIESGTNLNSIIPDWKQQLKQIISDIKHNHVYKITMYPCYHFVKDNCLKAFGFYTTCDYNEQPIDIELYRPLLNKEREQFIDSVWPNGKVDFAILNEYSLTEYVKWPEDPLPDIFKEVYTSSSS